jgi:hypothetical protein
MKKYIILILCLVLSIFELNAVTYNVYKTDVQNGAYTNTPYIPFNSTSPYMQTVNYNTVKPLNFDGTVSMEYTTYKGVYKPKYIKNSLGDIDGDPVGGTTPIGEPIIPCLVIMFVYIICREIKNKLFMQKK